MAGTTGSQALPFPYLDETVTSVSTKNLADAIALKLDAKDLQRIAALQRPVAIALRFANQSIPNNAVTAITFDTEVTDTHAMINIAGQPTRITIGATAGAGLYYFEAFVGASPGATITMIEVSIRKNGTSDRWRHKYWTFPPRMSTAGLIEMTSTTDYCEITVYHFGSGAAVNFSNVYLRAFKVAT